MTYRVEHSRFDIPNATWCHFQADTDEEAKQKFDEICKDKALAWDRVTYYKLEPKMMLVEVPVFQGGHASYERFINS